ncbi:transporter [Halodesulfovibrio spirochaetisodalis]|uniref:Transporter n=1 Tax=Halodesulfovibrio spirochaetisodalis TaxID=1560234 RepID=A0A1B7XAU9_9BACT|nr:transporter [Halodesulfovibrio spirochaetisodalis]
MKDSTLWIVKVLRKNTALTIFITLALGYYIGAIKLGSFSLGSVTGTLLIGVLIGQLGIDVSPQVKSIFFTMFLFAVGYSVGPQFVRGVARDGAPQAIFAVVICALCLLTTYVVVKFAGLDVGYAAGVWAGAQTISASIGLATDAINNSAISNPQEMLNHIPIAYAITYLFGTIGTGMILSYLGPSLIRTDLQKACKDYEAKLSKGAPEEGMKLAWHQLEVRAFEVLDSGDFVGKNIEQVESFHKKERIFIEKVKRGDEVIEPTPDMVINAGDVIAISAPTEVLIALEPHTKEVADKELLSIPMETLNLVITNKAANGKTLLDLSKEKFARGVFLEKITRGATSVDVPILAQTTLHRGDILKLTGSKTHTERIEKELGYADRTSTETDMVWVGIFILLFGLIGAISVDVGGVPITLSVSGGVLIGGLILGWLRSVHPTFGRLPAPTQWFMNSVGLNVFIAIVGISAGPGFVSGIEQEGLGLLTCGLIATAVPMLLAPLIGKYIFKFDPAINLGCCGGARTSTASVAMVGDAAKSNIPMLGYTVPYAVSNTLLTLIGMIIVLIY